ncbi:MAG: glycoside hydrolase [Prevotella sp.]|nr:glycoside hydrolase [Candidatus Prevotella equi]
MNIKPILLFCLLVMATAESNARSIVIDTERRAQTFEGWGVSLCWWANMCGKWDEEKVDEIVDWLTSPEGLNYNIFRYNIGGGDDPQWRHCTPHHMAKGKGERAEMEGFKDGPDCDYDWSRDEGQRRIMLKIKEKRPDAIFEAFSNSPPYWMTYSGCVGGNIPANSDNLRPEYYEAFAHYLVDVCKHYKEAYGIEFRTLEPFNEPVTNYWNTSGSQEGCYFSTESQIAFLKVLKPVLDASGLGTVISASDETSVEQSVKDFKAYANDGTALDIVSQWNTHTYHATDDARREISELARKHGKRLWMSEVGDGGRGIFGNLKVAKKLIDDIRHIKPVAWVDWQYIEEFNDQWCLVTGHFKSQRYHKIKNYYVRQQFSRFLTAGCTFIETENDETLAALSQDNNLVIVMLNKGREAVTREIRIKGKKEAVRHEIIKAYRTSINEDLTPVSSDGLTFSLPAHSVTTVIMRLP